MADTWTTKTALSYGQRRYSAGASIGTDKGYRSGGDRWAGGADYKEHEEYSQSGDSWAQKTSMPGDMPTGPGGANLGSDKMYVTGSMSNLANYEYSQGGNSWSTKTGSSNWTTGGVGVVDKLCTIGSDKMYGTKNSHEEYSQSGDSWTAKTDPTGSGGAAGFTLGSDKYYVVPAGSPGTANYEYSQSGNSWTTKTSKGESCSTPGGEAASGKGYIAGGHHATSNTAIQTTEEYNQSGDSWSTKTNMPADRETFPFVLIGSYKCYAFGGADPYSSNFDTNFEYTAAEPPVYEAFEYLRSFLDAEYPTGLADLKVALEAHGWSLEDLMAEVQTQAYTALEDLKAELSGYAWGYEDLKTLLDGHAQALEGLKTDVATSNLVHEGLRCELKTRDTQGPYVFNYPNPVPGQTGVAVNTNVTIVIRDDGWGVDIDSVWVEVDGVKYVKDDAGFSYSGTPREYVIAIDPTSDFEYNRSVSVKAFAADLAGNPGLNQVTQ
ncbi:MAG: hypothetical protein V3V45_01085 [Candidatus Brocadiales bacterium]